MLRKFFSSKKDKGQKKFNVLISEQDRYYREYLARLIRDNRAAYSVFKSTEIERFFDFIYNDMTIDILFFDIEAEKNTDNLAILKAIKPQTRLIHWSNCQHPEVIEHLYTLGVRTFCLKDSQPPVLLNGLDYGNNNRKTLYLDKQLHKCLYLLKG